MHRSTCPASIAAQGSGPAFCGDEDEGPQPGEPEQRTGGSRRGHRRSLRGTGELGRGCCVTKGIKHRREPASLKMKDPKETVRDKVSRHPVERQGERRAALPHSPAGTDPAELRLTPRDCFYFASAGPSRWKGIPTVSASSN